ncbi:SDR family NAD(P)-dependent oxidoreductase [Nocardiopsis sp. LOL_012]|uniref:SDR family NAD(P)-dependent oxidoreductase n=1 Tax=Nocardiopsis sp. LOL_012 TaxID=3345409 RepID=UPI003A8A8017
MDLGLKDKKVIVTGGASGIGRSAARMFAEAGASVLVADLNESATQETVRELGATGATVASVVGDLSAPETVQRVVDSALVELGGIDVLVNNAGIMDDMAATADVTDASWERLLRINLTAPFLLTRAVLPHMKEKGAGSIVFTASEASLRGSAAGTAYTVSKHAVVGLVKSTAVMYRDAGIRVNAVAPGGTATNIYNDMQISESEGPAVVGKYGANIGRVAESDELASTLVFLASDAASNVSGTILPVDNGWSAV